jgi:hypothetical protein
MARYFRRGTTKIYFVSSISSAASPTVAELSGATELTCSIAEISGFAFQNNPIDVPDMCAEFVKKIPGEDTADDSEMTFYEDNTSNPLLTTLAKGAEGFVVFFPYGIGGVAPVAGDDCEVWPVSVAKTTREWSAGNDPARFMTTFTITNVPGLAAEVKP